jgi:hypothetical protein
MRKANTAGITQRTTILAIFGRKQQMNKQELLAVAKPALFNTDMVLAILNNRKTMTRRVIKPKYSNTHIEWREDKYGKRIVEIETFDEDVHCRDNGNGTKTLKIRACMERLPQYRKGDILYVRETWWSSFIEELNEDDIFYVYKAGCSESDLENLQWSPSIHMPKAAARIFLRVKNVRAERLQDITEADAKAEGITSFFLHKEHGGKWHESNGSFLGVDFNTHNTRTKAFEELWDSIYVTPQPLKSKGKIYAYVSFPWNGADRENREYKGKSHYVLGNPFVWVYEFERIEVK